LNWSSKFLPGVRSAKNPLHYVEGRLQLRSYEDREGQKRNVTEVVVTTLRFLGSAKNGNGAKASESSNATQAIDESDNPFSEAQSEPADENIPL
jgi:single-strand DNA-binding protein